MAMKNLRDSQAFATFQHRARVEGKALGVIRIIAGGGAIQAIAVEKRRIVYKVKLHAGVAATIQDGTKPVLIIKGYGDARQQRFGVCDPGLFIFGQVDRNVVSECSQCLGECAYHIGKAAGLGERNALRSGEDNVQDRASEHQCNTIKKSKWEQEAGSICAALIKPSWDRIFWRTEGPQRKS